MQGHSAFRGHTRANSTISSNFAPPAARPRRSRARGGSGRAAEQTPAPARADGGDAGGRRPDDELRHPPRYHGTASVLEVPPPHGPLRRRGGRRIQGERAGLLVRGARLRDPRSKCSTSAPRRSRPRRAGRLSGGGVSADTPYRTPPARERAALPPFADIAVGNVRWRRRSPGRILRPAVRVSALDMGVLLGRRRGPAERDGAGIRLERHHVRPGDGAAPRPGLQRRRRHEQPARPPPRTPGQVGAPRRSRGARRSAGGFIAYQRRRRGGGGGRTRTGATRATLQSARRVAEGREALDEPLGEALQKSVLSALLNMYMAAMVSGVPPGAGASALTGGSPPDPCPAPLARREASGGSSSRVFPTSAAGAGPRWASRASPPTCSTRRRCRLCGGRPCASTSSSCITPPSR